MKKCSYVILLMLLMLILMASSNPMNVEIEVIVTHKKIAGWSKDYLIYFNTQAGMKLVTENEILYNNVHIGDRLIITGTVYDTGSIDIFTYEKI